VSDVLVFGGGMAGAVAALKARERGANVMVVRRALGATALSSGAVDVAPEPGALPGELIAQHVDPLEAAREVARRSPHHPYAVLADKLSRLSEALRFTAERLPELLSPPSARNMLLPTPLGTVKPAALAQRSMVADLTAMPEKVAVVDFVNIPGFDAQMVARGLEAAARNIGRPLSTQVLRSELFQHLEDALRLPHELATRLDEEAALESLAAELKRLLPADVRVVLFPPVLGRRSSDVFTRLSGRVGAECLEVLSGPPSVPGLRLQDALDAALERAGVRRWTADVDGTRAKENLFDIGMGQALTASAVVLATGKYIGGGIARRGGRFVETLLGVPVFSGSRRLTDEYVGALLDRTMDGDHAVYRAGVRIDASLRPLDESGAPAFPHVYAAGSVIQGYDAAADKTGLGVAIFTGFLAGEAAAAT
jgi:glycerol-3-phosphate dehydrogenase subunit B